MKLPVGDVRLPQEAARGRGPHRGQAADRRHPAGELRGCGGRERRREAARLDLPGADRRGRVDGLRAVRPLHGGQSDQNIESQELRELAEDAGGGEVPSAGEQGQIVARLDPESKVQEGQEAEIWVDAEPPPPVRPRGRPQPDRRKRRTCRHGRRRRLAGRLVRKHPARPGAPRRQSSAAPSAAPSPSCPRPRWDARAPRAGARSRSSSQSWVRRIR